MNIFEKIYQRAKKVRKKIVLPEGDEPRVIEAASYIVRMKLAQIIILGEAATVAREAKKHHLDVSKIEIINPKTDKKLNDYVNLYYNLRKHRGMTLEKAKDLLSQDFVYFGAMMLRQARVDGFVAGASYTTSDVVRASLHCIDLDPKHSIASSSFLVKVKDTRFGEDGLFLFADCGIVPNPTANQLADIAVASAELWVEVTGYEPRIAMLSFSTKGSSSAAGVEKVREAYEIAKRTKPDLIIDGELQVDSAIVPAVAQIKAAQSPLAGRANILIFPHLDAGNIAYKLVQRLAQARVAGPLIQGLGKPCSDLSRGCSSQEIIDAIAVTAVMAQ